MSGIPVIEEKCAGALVASAVGDALGWPNEFNAKNISKQAPPSLSSFVEWQRRTGGQYWSHIETIRAGEYSDDTQLILAVARSLLSGKPWDDHFSSVELPFWQKYERGGGGAVKRAALSWGKNKNPWFGADSHRYFEAGGNGAAMRILPHAIVGVREKNFESVAENVVRNSLLTHGHPRAIVGAVLYAYALFVLLKKNNTLLFGELVGIVLSDATVWGKFPDCFTAEWSEITNPHMNYNQAWIDTVNNTVSKLKIISAAIEKGAIDIESETLTALGCFDKRVNGAGDIAAVSAIYFASKYANNPTLGIKSAAGAIGSDTDTIASMAGGLLGALCGLEWIPAEWKLVQDYDCLVRFANFLLSENGSKLVREFASARKNDKNAVWERLAIGKCRELETRRMAAGKTGTVQISTYVTSLGQTIYVKKLTRKNTENENISAPKTSKQDNDVFQVIHEILTSARIATQAKISDTINFAMVETYWDTGRLLTEEVGSRAEYGQELLSLISDRLKNEFGQGFTVANLQDMQQFYKAFPNRYALHKDLKWSHYRQLMKIDDKEKREFYMLECIRLVWSPQQLEQRLNDSACKCLLSENYPKNIQHNNRQNPSGSCLFDDNDAAEFLELRK